MIARGKQHMWCLTSLPSSFNILVLSSPCPSRPYVPTSSPSSPGFPPTFTSSPAIFKREVRIVKWEMMCGSLSNYEVQETYIMLDGFVSIKPPATSTARSYSVMSPTHSNRRLQLHDESSRSHLGAHVSPRALRRI